MGNASPAADSLLLVTVDTVRADRLQPYGAADVETPNLQALADRGVVFERAYAVAPITLPAHASLLTGLYPLHIGVRNNGTHFLAADRTTLAERLEGAGFHTGAFVSATVLERQYGLAQGFARYDDDVRSPLGGGNGIERSAAGTVDAALGWIDGLPSDARFFAWVHLFDPHSPYAPPAPFAERYRERPYDGEIAFVDQEIGRLLRHPRLSKSAGTAVVVVGDHAESLGEHGEPSHGMLVYDATLRIPWIMSFPGGPEGLRREEPVDQVDLLPTALGLLGVAISLPVDGRSLISGDSGDTQDRGLYSESLVPFYTYGWARLHAWRRGAWKYIDAPDPELYDTLADPEERQNLHSQHRDRARDLATELSRFERSSVVDLPTRVAAEDEARLRSLGYLGSAPASTRADPRDPKASMDLHRDMESANQALIDGRFEAARRELRAVLERDPENVRALSDLATADRRLGDLDAGIRSLETALELAPEAPQLYLQLAAFEEQRGGVERALELAERALALDPAYLEATLEKATYLERLGRRSEAAALLEEALRRLPDHPELNAAYAELSPISAADRNNRAIELSRQGRAAEARAALESLVADHPDYAPGLINLAWIDAGEKNWQAAEQSARRALEIDSASSAAWSFLGQTQQAQGRLDGARASYQKASRLAPADWQSRVRLAIVLLEQGDRPAGIAELAEVEKRAGDDPEARFQLAWIWDRALDDDQHARSHYEAFLRLAPDDPRAADVRSRLAPRKK